MKKIIMESSSDEDDTYTNSVTRLRALKKQRLEKEKLAVSDSIQVIEAPISDKESIIQTGYTNTRSHRGRGRPRKNVIVNKTRGRPKATNAIVRSIRTRQTPIDTTECDVQIVSITKKKSDPIPKSCEDNVITLSSDDEVCSEDDNYEINIKVLWRSSRLDRFNIHRNDSFLKIFQHYADLEKVSVDEILIMKKDKRISYTDTPALHKLSVIDILDGGIVNPGMNTLCQDKNKDKQEEDVCNIKVQTANKKQSLIISLKKDQRFEALFISCAQQFGVKEENLKLYFDGEQIDSSDTPKSLDLDGEACIDLHISSM